MEINSTQKQAQNHFQGYHIAIELPFSIKSGNVRKGQHYERDGHWNQKQRLKYSVFLSFFRAVLEDPVRKKRVRVYDMMSDMIVTRNSNQCRSHHQKMEKYRTTVPEIVASVAEKYEPSVYRELSQRYLALLKTLLENSEKYIRTTQDPNDRHPHKKQPAVKLAEDDPVGSAIKEPGLQVEPPLDLGPEIKTEYKAIEQIFVEKKQLKRTSDQYEEKKVDPEQEDVPMMRLEDFSGEDGEGEPSQDRADPEAGLAGGASEEGQGQVGSFYLDSESRFYYEQQVAALRVQRQWHAQNADQLYGQWSSEVQNIKFCDQTIKLYSQMLAAPRNARHSG